MHFTTKPIAAIKQLFSATLMLIMLSALPNVSLAAEKDKTYSLTILHTNDHHGHFWQNSSGEYGLSAQKTLVDRIRGEIRAKGGESLLLSGGDINTGVPESDLQDAKPDFLGMKTIGYDAMAVGNHEFDNPLSVLRTQQSWAGFPFLSANIYDKTTKKRLFSPYAIFNKGGLKIAVIGLTTDDTAKIGNPEYLGNVEFRNPVPEIKAVIETLRKTEKPDVVIAVTHMGHYDDGKHGGNAPGDVTMARQLPAGYLDLIVGGHSQDPVCMKAENQKDAAYVPGSPCVPERQNDTWIVQAHEWGKYVGQANFNFKNGKLTLDSYALIPVNLKKKIKQADGTSALVPYTEEIPQDNALLTMLTPYQEEGQANLAKQVGSVDDRLEGDRKIVRFQQTNLGMLIAAAQAERAKADFGVVNSGGIRDSINAGTISYKDVLKVQPFANMVAYVELSGKELLAYLSVVANKPTDSGGYAQFSSNISLIADGAQVSQVSINGKPLDEKTVYRMSLPSFLASGGDGYPNVQTHPSYVNTGFVDAEVLKDYIEKRSPIKVANYNTTGVVYKK